MPTSITKSITKSTAIIPLPLSQLIQLIPKFTHLFFFFRTLRLLLFFVFGSSDLSLIPLIPPVSAVLRLNPWLPLRRQMAAYVCGLSLWESEAETQKRSARVEEGGDWTGKCTGKCGKCNFGKLDRKFDRYESRYERQIERIERITTKGTRWTSISGPVSDSSRGRGGARSRKWK